MKILCLHGLGGGANSNTSRQLKSYFENKASRQSVEILAPEIPIMPTDAFKFISELQECERPDIVIGTSLGGFYARYLHGTVKVLINPAMQADDVKTAVGYGTYSFFKPRQRGGQTYTIDEAFIYQLQEIANVQDTLIDEQMKSETFALFGTSDALLSNYSLFTSIYSVKNARYIEAEHRLSDKNIECDLIPLIEELISKIINAKH